MMVSGTRCLLAYIVFPYLIPVLGLADLVGPAVGLAIGAVAIVFNGVSIRRFWRGESPAEVVPERSQRRRDRADVLHGCR